MNAVDAQAHELGIALGKEAFFFGKSAHFRSTDRREVGGVGKEDDPTVLVVIGEFQVAGGSDGFEVRSFVTDAGHEFYLLLFHFLSVVWLVKEDRPERR